MVKVSVHPRCMAPVVYSKQDLSYADSLLQDALGLSLPRQQALLEVLAAAAAPLGPLGGGGGGSGGGMAVNWAAGGMVAGGFAPGPTPGVGLSGVPLLPLLHLASGSPSPGLFHMQSNKMGSIYLSALQLLTWCSQHRHVECLAIAAWDSQHWFILST